MTDISLPGLELPYQVSGEASSPASALVFDSPHSWRDWPADGPPIIATQDALMTSWDAWVDEIWIAAADGRAPVVSARFHRSYIDANRALDDIDARMLAEPWVTATRPSQRSQRGFGLLRRHVLPEVPLYGHLLPIEDVARRIRCCYDPYHAKVASLIAAARAHNGVAVHINCHSMKSVGNAMNDDAGMPRPDLVVSDLDGVSADPSLTRWVAASLGVLGYQVLINHPYRGGELIRRHANPAQGRHSLQIEINRALYMNERTFERTEGFARLVADLKAFVGQLHHTLGTAGAPPWLPAR